ncbi:MAG: hypothetical protein RL375_138 [Pseudomonadota bacterium]
MTLKIVDRPEFETTVDVATRHLQGSFKVRFVALPGSKLKAAEEKAIRDGKGPEGLLFEVCTWFEPVELPDVLLQYVDVSSLATLLDYPGIGPAMVKTYFRALWEEARGN